MSYLVICQRHFVTKNIKLFKRRESSDIYFHYTNWFLWIYHVQLSTNRNITGSISRTYVGAISRKSRLQAYILSIGRDGQLRTSFYNKRDDFNFYTTNFPFLSSNFHFCQPMVCLSHNSYMYGMPELALLMNVLFRERCDFHVSFSGRDMTGNVWNRPSGSSVVDMGISSNIMNSPSPKCNMTLGTWSYTLLPSINQTFHWIVTLLPN